MAYQFRGFFTEWNPPLGEAASRRWPSCTWRPIYDPFLGIGVRCPDVGRATDGASYNRLLELTYRIERELPDFVAEFGNPLTVFVEAESFGGVCVYGGWVLQTGVLDLHIRMTDALETSTGNLNRLLAPLGMEADTVHFPPFVRGFWGD